MEWELDEMDVKWNIPLCNAKSFIKAHSLRPIRRMKSSINSSRKAFAEKADER